MYVQRKKERKKIEGLLNWSPVKQLFKPLHVAVILSL